MDVLSDVLSAVRLTGAVFFDVDASPPWCGVSPGVERIARRVMPDAEHVIGFHAILSGSCWVSLEDASAVPFLANAGDVLVVPGGAAACDGLVARATRRGTRPDAVFTGQSTPSCPSP